MTRALFLLDGENLVFRFETMVKEGRKQTGGAIHSPGLFVWHPNFASFLDPTQVVRVGYYTSWVASEDGINQARDQIGAIMYSKAGFGLKICPHVFKKPSKSQKSKNVDIGITIDALRHTYQNHIDHLYLFSGDGDYIPLIVEVMRQGKRVTVGALSSGLHPELKRIPDSFMDLDQSLFSPIP